MTVLRSKDNPKVKRWMRLATDGRFRRKEGCALVEGPHLVEAGFDRIKNLLLMEGELTGEIRSLAGRFAGVPIILPKTIFRSLVDTDTPQSIAAEIEIPQPGPQAGDSVYLEGIQDAGNVGAILRSAAAFGIKTVYVGKDTADPWSPKVLRAGAGGHFLLSIVAGEPPDGTRLACTVVKGGTALGDANLSGLLCWVFGSEGKGVSAEVQRKAALRITIPIARGTESLNVAATAAICLHEAFSRRAGGS
jgi:TrmH family RNA methyltransferase